jgi:UDP:flavonoid glycosyltransferase YjiC (YdhE family)
MSPTSDPAPLLFTPTSNVLAHVGRCVILARELQRRGHRIIFAGLPRYLTDPGVVSSGEFEFYELPDFDLDEGLEILRTVRKRPLGYAIEANIAAERRLLRSLRPRAVIVDFRPSIYISARLHGVPLIALLGGRWLYQYAARPYRAFRTYAHYPLIRRLVGLRGADLLMPPLQRLAMRYKSGPLARAFKRHGLAARKTPWDMLVGDYNLILDTALMCPMKPLPDTFAKVGPIFWSPVQSLPPWVPELNHRRPLIYVTMGSTAHPALFRVLLEVFRGLKAQILMTTGGQITLRAEETPSNVRVEKYLPGAQVMAYVDLVIHHGGIGTVYQTISAAKPSIAVATHFEQEIIGAMLEDHGAGILLTMREVMRDPAVLTRTIAKVLSSTSPYQKHLARLQQDLQQYNPVQSAAMHIEAFLAALQGHHDSDQGQLANDVNSLGLAREQGGSGRYPLLARFELDGTNFER